MPAKGKFIVLEGLDKSGKSTQANILARDLNAQPLAFPDRTTPTGHLLHSYLSRGTDLPPECVHLIFSANRWEAHLRILALLDGGTHVVCDRYTFSGLAFSMAKGLDEEWCAAPDKGLVEPDLVIFLSVSEEVQRQRGDFGGERYETSSMQGRVRRAFGQIAQGQNGRWVQVDADGSLEDVTRRIRDVVQERLQLQLQVQ